ncbi:hypothetical protein ACAW74_18230 [Fibrella sp. WM1]|uniref:hypothetical protein n=1 Tax=Fibrella musci TaxID=3242485 RepID=UPI00351FE5F9
MLPQPTPTESSPPVDDIDALLSQDTNYIPPAPTTDDGTFVPPPDAKPVDPNDFDDLDEAAPDPDAPDEPQPKGRAFFRRQATQLVRTFDVAQKTLLRSWVYPRTILEPGDRELVTEYRTRAKAAKKTKQLQLPDQDDDLWNALNRYEQLDKACEELPLTDDEKADLIAPLADVLEKHQKGALSPEMALLLAVAMIMLPRLEPVFPKLFSSFK